MGSIEEVEDHLVGIITEMAKLEAGRKRDSMNRQLLNELNYAMAYPGAMEYDFEKLEMISILTTEMRYYRFLTWEMENADEEIEYHGMVCHNAGKWVQTQRLFDKSPGMGVKAKYEIMSPMNWYGAMYYDLMEFEYKGEGHIVLLGINRNSTLTKKKVIEIVNTGDSIQFGLEIFDTEKRGDNKREIYEYSVEADMSVWFEEGKDDLIVMDHLSPLKPMYQDKPEYYVPDLSFDALEFKKGKWVLIEDYDAKRGKRLNDRFYEMELPEEKKIY